MALVGTFIGVDNYVYDCVLPKDGGKVLDRQRYNTAGPGHIAASSAASFISL